MHIAHLIKQKGYEKIEYLLRRHPLTYVPKVLLFLVLMTVPFVVYFLINSLFPNLFMGEIIYALSVLLASIYFLGIYLFFYTQFLEFYLDSWIVTNDRIVDIEQHGLFSRTISELDRLFSHSSQSPESRQILLDSLPIPNKKRLASVAL